MSTHTIEIFIDGAGWMARDTDPAVRELFGTDTLPTPFLKDTPAAEVLDVLTRLNPGKVVCRRPAAPTFNARAALRDLIAGGFVGPRQAAALRQLLAGEEGAWFAGRLAEISATVATMPATHQGDGLARLHYFTRGADWFIVEKDIGDPDDARHGIAPQSQAFGLADLDAQRGASPYAEQGYISLPELFAAGAELDLHWEPRTLAQLRKGGAA